MKVPVELPRGPSRNRRYSRGGEVDARARAGSPRRPARDPPRPAPLPAGLAAQVRRGVGPDRRRAACRRALGHGRCIRDGGGRRACRHDRVPRPLSRARVPGVREAARARIPRPAGAGLRAWLRGQARPGLSGGCSRRSIAIRRFSGRASWRISSGADGKASRSSSRATAGRSTWRSAAPGRALPARQVPGQVHDDLRRHLPAASGTTSTNA